MKTGRPAKFQRSDFGKKLIAARLRLGLTQAQVALRVGVSQQAYAGWERRTLAIRPQHIAGVARALGLGLEDLLGGDRGSSKCDIPVSRAYDTLLRIGKLTQQEQDRIMDVVEDLISGAKKRRNS